MSRIDRLRLTLPHASGGAAPDMARLLGERLAERLAGRADRLDHLVVRGLAPTPHEMPAQLAARLADDIIAALDARSPGREEGQR